MVVSTTLMTSASLGSWYKSKRVRRALRVIRTTPTTAEQDLHNRYIDTIKKRTSIVRKGSKNRGGYIHIPDMERDGFAFFNRCYAVEATRDTLIIDVRGNGGGNISELLLPKLQTRRLAVTAPRHGEAMRYPEVAPPNPGLVCLLVDENTASDGECFAHSFKLLKLGLVIGATTHGSLLGVGAGERMVDGTAIGIPSDAMASHHGHNHDVPFGAIENRGVVPDVEVKVSPLEHTGTGADPCLAEAIRRLSEAARA